MGKSQRVKGASGEREACEALAPLYPDLKRGLIQTRGGSECPDIDSPDCEFWIEVKRGANPDPVSAYKQAKFASECAYDERPTLVLTRKDRCEWLVTMNMIDRYDVFGPIEYEPWHYVHKASRTNQNPHRYFYDEQKKSDKPVFLVTEKLNERECMSFVTMSLESFIKLMLEKQASNTSQNSQNSQN